MVEQRSPKPTVEGSSPSAPARHNEAPLGVFLFLAHLKFLMAYSGQSSPLTFSLSSSVISDAICLTLSFCFVPVRCTMCPEACVGG